MGWCIIYIIDSETIFLAQKSQSSNLDLKKCCVCRSPPPHPIMPPPFPRMNGVRPHVMVECLCPPWLVHAPTHIPWSTISFIIDTQTPFEIFFFFFFFWGGGDKQYTSFYILLHLPWLHRSFWVSSSADPCDHSSHCRIFSSLPVQMQEGVKED